MKHNPWWGNKKCPSCGACLDIEEIKFDKVCPICGTYVGEDE